jgi:hypothetical protein
MVFDHFVRTAQRPQTGPHGLTSYGGHGDVLRSLDDSNYSATKVLDVPNGAYGTGGGFETFSSGGKLVENQLDPTKGDYESDYTLNAGSYYDKAWSAMMMTESVDNFISDSRGDFVDKRYRATSLADLLPDGYRRWLANSLTNDEFLKGARIAADVNGNPITTNVAPDGADPILFPDGSIGNTMWWTDPPQACFPKDGATICAAYGSDMDNGDAPANVAVIESQMGWETQKFLITMTNCYLPENQQQWWSDMMAVYDITLNNDAVTFDKPIKFHNPDGKSFVARRFGRETIFGKEVEKGIGARVLEYANELLERAYETTPVHVDGDGIPDWYEVVRTTGGDPIVKYDPSIGGMSTGSFPAPDCTDTDNSGCTCDMNQACVELEQYVTLIDWMKRFTAFRNYSNTFTGIYN